MPPVKEKPLGHRIHSLNCSGVFGGSLIASSGNGGKGGAVRRKGGATSHLSPEGMGLNPSRNRKRPWFCSEACKLPEEKGSVRFANKFTFPEKAGEEGKEGPLKRGGEGEGGRAMRPYVWTPKTKFHLPL